MKARELLKLGVPKGETVRLALEACGHAARDGLDRDALRTRLKAVLAHPDDHLQDRTFGALAAALARLTRSRTQLAERSEPAPYRQWGRDLDTQSLQQMANACRLPVTVAGALMPDAHVGYGLPIGGVLATENAVIPYAVGMDIACRMKMTVFDLPVADIQREESWLRDVLGASTRFGVGTGFTPHKDHAVMAADWSFSSVTRRCQDKASFQLGTSGSGNHFVEFGTLTIDADDLGLKAGVYTALLSHSGSRGTGGQIAMHYSKLAAALHPELPRDLQQLAWLDLDTDAGREYWMAMELMGHYAAANHALIHQEVARRLRARVLLDLENHHNFAWREQHFGRDVIVHRKGATPAGAGVLGIIPGSMAAPGFVVRGKGVAASMNSAAHGAGRRMSRTAARNTYTWADSRKVLAERGVSLISAGLDEVPMAYKDILAVMEAQRDLVAIIARFDPRLVKMAADGERPED